MMRLLNAENNNELEEVEMVEGPIKNVTEREVKRLVKKMKDGRALGASD